MSTSIYQIDSNRCTGCGACVEACPQGALAIRNGIASLDAPLCRGCGVCAESCPVGAIFQSAPLPAPRPVGSRLPVPIEDQTGPVPVLYADRGAGEQVPSLLARMTRTVVPAALGLVVSFGEAWLNGLLDRQPSARSASGSSRCGAQLRRRSRRRGRV